MKRPGYREAIEWMVYNDDLSFLDAEEPIISVTAAMVRDLHGVATDRLFADMRRARRMYAIAEAKRIVAGIEPPIF